MIPKKEDVSPGSEDLQQNEGLEQGKEEGPEFWLDDEGNLQGSFDDWDTGEEGQKASVEGTEEEPVEEGSVQGEEGEEEGSKEGVSFYSPEELASLDFEQVDPSRLPPEVRPYYEAVAKQQASELSQEQPSLSDVYEKIQEEARRRVEEKLGEAFDEFNPKHIAALAVEASKVGQEFERRLAVQKKIAELQAQEPYFAQIEKYASEKLMELPAKEYIKIQQAMAEGNYDELFRFWEKCRREFYERKLGQKAGSEVEVGPVETEKKVEKPPVVEGAGKGEVETQPNIRPQDFARMSEEEQIEALIRLGLVE